MLSHHPAAVIYSLRSRRFTLRYCVSRTQRAASQCTNIVFTLQQVIYSLRSSRELSNSLKLLLGAGRGDDVAGSLNSAAGRGLTHLTRFGAAPHQRVCGSGLGGAWSAGHRTHAAAAHLISGQRLPESLCLQQHSHRRLHLQAAPITSTFTSKTTSFIASLCMSI